jgi:hypothetical protein
MDGEVHHLSRESPGEYGSPHRSTQDETRFGVSTGQANT